MYARLLSHILILQKKMFYLVAFIVPPKKNSKQTIELHNNPHQHCEGLKMNTKNQFVRLNLFHASGQTITVLSLFFVITNLARLIGNLLILNCSLIIHLQFAEIT